MIFRTTAQWAFNIWWLDLWHYYYFLKQYLFCLWSFLQSSNWWKCIWNRKTSNRFIPMWQGTYFFLDLPGFVFAPSLFILFISACPGAPNKFWYLFLFFEFICYVSDSLELLSILFTCTELWTMIKHSFLYLCLNVLLQTEFETTRLFYL